MRREGVRSARRGRSGGRLHLLHLLRKVLLELLDLELELLLREDASLALRLEDEPVQRLLRRPLLHEPFTEARVEPFFDLAELRVLTGFEPTFELGKLGVLAVRELGSKGIEAGEGDGGC